MLINHWVSFTVINWPLISSRSVASDIHVNIHEYHWPVTKFACSQYQWKSLRRWFAIDLQVTARGRNDHNLPLVEMMSSLLPAGSLQAFLVHNRRMMHCARLQKAAHELVCLPDAKFCDIASMRADISIDDTNPASIIVYLPRLKALLTAVLIRPNVDVLIIRSRCWRAAILHLDQIESRNLLRKTAYGNLLTVQGSELCFMYLQSKWRIRCTASQGGCIRWRDEMKFKRQRYNRTMRLRHCDAAPDSVTTTVHISMSRPEYVIEIGHLLTQRLKSCIKSRLIKLECIVSLTQWASKPRDSAPRSQACWVSHALLSQWSCSTNTGLPMASVTDPCWTPPPVL